MAFVVGILAPLIVMTKEVLLKYPPAEPGGEMPTAMSCHLQMAPDVKKLYFTVMGMVFYGITAIVSIAFLCCTICKAMNIDLDNYFVKDDFKNHVSASSNSGRNKLIELVFNKLVIRSKMECNGKKLHS